MPVLTASGSKPWSYTGGRSLNTSGIYQTAYAHCGGMVGERTNGPLMQLLTLNDNLECRAKGTHRPSQQALELEVAHTSTRTTRASR